MIPVKVTRVEGGLKKECQLIRKHPIGLLIAENTHHRGKYHCKAGLDSVVSAHTNNNIFLFAETNTVKPESSHTVILPPLVSVLCSE